MLGLKGFASAAITIRGVELMHCIRKGRLTCMPWQFRGELRPKSGQPFWLLELTGNPAQSAPLIHNLHQSPDCRDFHGVRSVR
jgi:hypothetical protein